MNWALKKLNNEFTMLHYPLYKSESDSFFQAQKNLTDYCISLLESIKNKDVLEIGCGNGIQALYINNRYHPWHFTGIDLNKDNIEIANREKEHAYVNNVRFLIDDAQNLRHIPSNSVDVVLNIESAFHYPDKPSFLKEIHRVLKPKGQFLIADLLARQIKRRRIIRIWKKKILLYHWDHDRYIKEFVGSNLIGNHFEDITNQVIKGFNLYRNWMPVIKWKNFFQDIAFRTFYYVNVKLYIYLLSHNRSYGIFVGYKPELST
jgi:ubiquinone/menaquinone biosynthesis C-methylase UbiE